MENKETIENGDLGIVNLIVFACIVASVLLGTVFNITIVMNLIKFTSPFLMLIILVGTASLSAKQVALKNWRKTGRPGFPTDFGKDYVPKAVLFYKLVHVGYLTIVILLAGYGYFFLAVLWLVIWISATVCHAIAHDMYNKPIRRQP